MDKPFRTLDELCDLLVGDRGLICPDRGALRACLSMTSYYRFSGYAREFQRNPKYGDNRFEDGVSFAEVVHAFAVLRNLCAHHRQIWHRRIDIQCPMQKKLKPRNITFDVSGPYSHVLMANHYRSRIDGDTEVASKIQRLLDDNPAFAQGIYAPSPK